MAGITDRETRAWMWEVSEKFTKAINQMSFSIGKLTAAIEKQSQRCNEHEMKFTGTSGWVEYDGDSGELAQVRLVRCLRCGKQHWEDMQEGS